MLFTKLLLLSLLNHPAGIRTPTAHPAVAHTPTAYPAGIHPAAIRTPTPSFGVTIIGHGKPMILIPGLKGDGPATYATTIAHYKDHYTCYVITLAGFAGQPATARTSNVLQGQRDDLIQYVKDQHLVKPVLVGFSFGGVLALWAASAAPDLFGPVIDLDGAPYESAFESPVIDEDSLHKVVGGRLAMVNNASPQMVAHYDSLLHSPSAEKKSFQFLKKLVDDTTQIPMVMDWDRKSDLKATYRMLNEMAVLNLQDSIARIQSPILFLGSIMGYDFLTTEDQISAAAHRQFAKAAHVTIAFSKEGKHFLMWSDFDWMVGQMDAFLKG